MRLILICFLSYISLLYALIPVLKRKLRQHPFILKESDWKGDFDFIDDDDGYEFAKLFNERARPMDRSGIKVRQFSLGGMYA